MNKTAAGVIIAIISIGLIGGAVYSSNKNSDQKETGSMSMGAGDNHSMQPKDSSSNSSSDEVRSGEVSMDIKDFEFKTEKLKVKPGTKVTWTNQDDAKHDVAPDNKSPDFEGSGKLLAKGESYSYTFEKPGTFSYKCTPHPYMKASVEVVAQ